MHSNDYDEEEEEEEQLIDPKDLIIINDPKNWEPTQDQIVAYAEQLGFDIDSDPQELLQIAYNYLKKEIPSDWRRAFSKADNQLLYIDLNTNEIHLSTDIEESAKNELLQLKEDYRQKIKKEEEEAKKVKVIPRTKIPPLGQNKIKEDKNQKKEKKFIEKIEKQKQIERKKNFEKEDEETKTLMEKIYKDKLKEERLRKEKLNEKYSDEEDYNSKYGFNRNNDVDNNINLQDNNEDESYDANEKKQIKNYNKYHGKQQEVYEDQGIKDKIMKNKEKKEKNNLNLNLDDGEKGNDKVIAIENLNDINSHSNLNSNNLSNKEKNYSTPEKEKKKKYSPPKIEKSSDKKKENESDEEEEKEEEKEEEEIKYEKKDFTRDKNDYLKKVRKELREYENELKEKMENDKNELSKNIEEEYERKIIIEKRNLKDKIVKSEKEFINNLNDEDKFDKEIENYKIAKRKEMEDEKKYSSLNITNNYEKDINKLEREKERLLSQINIQKFKNENEKKQKQKGENEILKSKQLLIKEQINNKKTSLENNNKKELTKLERELEQKFNNFKKEVDETKKREIEILNKNKIQKENIEINEILKEYQKNLDENFENKKDEIRNELELKMKKELDDYKRIIAQDSNFKKDSINSQQGDLGKNYLNELDDLKIKEARETEKKEKEIKDKFEKSEKQLETLKNDMKKNSDNLVNEIIQKIKDIILNEKKEENLDKVKSNIDELLSSLFGTNGIKFKHKKSLYDIVEKNYKEKRLLIKYFIDILQYIKKIVIENPLNNIIDSNENKKIDDNQINDLIQYTKNKIEEFRNKYMNEMMQKLFPFLENPSNILNQSLNNINIPIPNSYLNMSSDNIMTDKINNAMMNQTLLNQNIMNQTMMNPNLNMNPNTSFMNNPNNMNQYLLNQNQLNQNLINPNNSMMNMQQNNFNQLNFDPMNTTMRTNYNPNLNIFKNNFEKPDNSQNRYLNQTMNNFNMNPMNNNLMEQSYYNMNSNLIGSLPEIQSDIIKNLSDEDFNLYNKINEFLIDESASLNREYNEYEKKKFYDNQMSQITEQGHYLQLSQIINDEKIKSIRYGKYFSDKISAFNLIKKRAEECYKFISDNSSRKDIFKDKFNLILQHINDYKKTIKSMKNPIEQKNLGETTYTLRKSPYLNPSSNMTAETIKNNYTNFYTYYTPNTLDTTINTPYVHQFFNTKKNNDLLNMRIMSNINPLNYSSRIERFENI